MAIKSKVNQTLAWLLLFFPAAALAHSKDAAGFVSGFTHPIFGPDHLLAMLGVGFVSARIEGHYIWSIPALFVFCMVFGGILGANGIMFPMVEFGIALSVIVLGLLTVFLKNVNNILIAILMVFVAFFGALHGHAHGVEMPDSISPIFYTVGFVVSTTLIHLLGVYLGHLPNKKESFSKLPTYVGSFMAVAGCFIFIGLF